MTLRRLLLAFALAFFCARRSLAQCNVSLSATVDGDVLHVSVTSTGTCGWSSIGDIDIDGVYYVGPFHLYECAAPTCTYNTDYSLDCFPPGTHTIHASGGCNVGSAQSCTHYNGTTSTTFTYLTAPKVTLEYVGGTETPGRFNVTWDFPELVVGQRIYVNSMNAAVRAFFDVHELTGSQFVDLACAPPDGDLVQASSSGCGYTASSPVTAVPDCDNACSEGGGGGGGGFRGGNVAAFVQQPAGATDDGGSQSCPRCVGHPVQITSGSMEFSDQDPIPGSVIAPLRRIYHSRNQLVGVFGQGWTTMLDSHVVATGDPYGMGNVFVQLEDGRRMVFAYASGSFVQTFPTGEAGVGTLEYVSSLAVFRYRAAGSAFLRDFDRTSGRLVSAGFPNGDTVTFTYTSGKPTSVADSRGRWSWTLVYGTSGFVETLNVTGHPELTWTYGYSSGNLVSVSAPSGLPWRTYVYDASGMTAALDAAGATIESHSYDSGAHAITSSGPSAEITSIDFNQAGRATDEWKTRVTTADGKTTDYYSRYLAGRMRTVEIDGSCNCGLDDAVFGYDTMGYVIREQNERGYITERTFSNGRLSSFTTLRKPQSCDPETDTSYCRLTPDTLLTATLEDTPLSTTTTLTYGNASWPDRPTEVSVNSLRAGQQRKETFTYDASTGQVLTHTVSGYDPTAPTITEIQRTTAATLYNGTEGAAFDPCAGSPSCAFSSAWLLLAQPASVVRRVDGPRSDVEDWTTYVYYPFDSGVPADARGRVAAVKNAAGHVTRFEDYDVFGNARRIIDPNGVITEATYDTLGRLLTSTLKGVSGCDTSLDPLCATDLITRRMYDPASGPLAIEIGPRGEATTYEYDTRGRITTLRRGDITGTIPSTATAAIAAAVWREKLEYAYSATSGHKVSETLFASESNAWVQKKTTSFAYDTSGHLATTTHADGNSVGYEYDRGQVSSVRGENHSTHNTLYSYDAGGRLQSVTQTLATAPDQTILTKYSYDAHGNLTKVSDPNRNVTTYAYDDFGELVKQTSPVTGTTTYLYDAAGNLASVSDSNHAATARTYDTLARPLTATSSRVGMSNESVTWTYDDTTASAFGLGRLASMTDPAGTTTYAYERRGLLRREQRTFTGTTEPYAATFRYDASGNRTSMTYASGLSVNSVFDYANRPYSQATSSANLIASTAYLPFGPAKDIVYSNGTQQTMAYDTRYRILENKLTGPTGTLAEYDYAYDAAGNITGIADAVDSGYDRTFAYDDLNRLVTANTGAALWRTGSYTYDAMGNMLSSKLGDPELTVRIEEAYFTYVGTTPKIATVRRTPLPDDFTELSRPTRPSRIERQDVGYQTVSYDAVGNELKYVATRSYSPRNLLAAVTDAAEVPTDSHRLEYGYDGRGIRVVRSETQADGTKPTRYFFYSPELQLLSTTADNAPNVYSLRLRTNSVPAVKYDFVWQASIPVAQLSSTFPTGIHWYFTDHLGTPLLQTDANAQIVWRAEYEPYGDIWTMRVPSPDDEAPPPTYEQPLRFPGQESAMRWEGTEERYNIFRWYRAGWGRYTQADPLGGAGDANPYAYVYGNPVNWDDPLGLFTVVSASPAEKKAIEAAFALIKSQMRKNNCADCKKYFASQPNLQDIDQWTQPGGPPYVSTVVKPGGVSPDIFGYSQKGSPFSYTWLFKDGFFPSSKKLSPCDLASLILHEAGHLARQDTTDNEPAEFFKKCRFGCINPGKFH